MHQSTVLDNGLTVVTFRMPEARSVGVALAAGTGSCYERDDEAGISHFIEHLCFKGTTRRPTPADISAEIEGIGGILNASTGREETVYWAKVTRSHMATAVDLLFDIAANSVLAPDDIEKERKVVIEEINMNLDLPQERVGMLIDSLLWPDQPLGRDVAGTKETVSAIGRSAIVDYMSRQYRTGNMIVSIAGDVGHDDVCELVAKHAGALAPGQPERSYKMDDSQQQARVGVDRRDGEQAHLCVAVHGVSRCDPRRYAVDALNVVLGGGMSSRLFTEIREKRGLAYDIHSYPEHFLSGGSLVVYAGVDPERLTESIKAVVGELARAKTGVSEEELRRAKELAKGRLELRLEDTQNAALWYGAQQLLTHHVLTVDEVEALIEAVTVDDVVRMAEEHFRKERLCLAVVGPVDDGIGEELLSL
jgi:predicted Zn-dependent peptidase